MTAPSLIDAARTVVYAGLEGHVGYAAVLALGREIDALPPDPVIVSRSLLIEARNELMYFTGDWESSDPDEIAARLERTSETLALLRQAAGEGKA